MEYWNDKYKSRPNVPMQPEDFIIKNLDSLIPGNLLDFACGDGRNALYLAKQGFKVTGIDFSIEALRRLQEFADKENISINIHKIDLTSSDNIQSQGAFDNIIISHYKPVDEVLKILTNLLNQGGVLLLCTFSHRQVTEREFPEYLCLGDGNLESILPDLSLLKHEIFEDSRGFLEGYIFKKGLL